MTAQDGAPVGAHGPKFVAIVDDELILRRCTPDYAQLLAYDDPRELIDRPAREFLADVDVAAELNDLYTSIARIGFHTHLAKLRDATGHTILFNSTIVAVPQLPEIPATGPLLVVVGDPVAGDLDQELGAKSTIIVTPAAVRHSLPPGDMTRHHESRHDVTATTGVAKPGISMVENFYTLDEIAQKLHRSRRTLYRDWHERHILHAEKQGRGTRVSESNLRLYIGRLEALGEATPPPPTPGAKTP